MKFFLLSLVFMMLAACNTKTVYSMIHERERQECLKQGRSDCQRVESYDKYKEKREEIINP